VNAAEQESVDELGAEIARCGKWLQDALDRGCMGMEPTHTLDDIAEGVAAGRYQLWPADDAAMVTELIQYPQARHIHVFLAGGNLETIKDMRPSIEEFGIFNECTVLSINGRPGWAKVFEDEGYRKGLTSTVKRLTLNKTEAAYGQ
jgi:hypothetical protein